MDWRDIPSLTALRAFEAAARTNSLSAAARELNVTHAAVAQHVRRLETHFGQTLMTREGQRMVPSEAGAALSSSLAEGFGTIATAVRDLLDADAIRPLRLAVTPSFAEAWLMPRIGAFWSAHPGIELEIMPSPQLVDLGRDQVDVAIRYGRGPWRGVTAEPLVSARHRVVAAPGKVKGPVATLSDLRNEHWLMERGEREMTLWAESQGLDFAGLRVTQMDTLTLATRAVRSGYGVTIVPEALIGDDLDQGRLEVLYQEDQSPLAYHLLTRPDRVSPALRTFIGWLRSEARR